MDVLVQPVTHARVTGHAFGEGTLLETPHAHGTQFDNRLGLGHQVEDRAEPLQLG